VVTLENKANVQLMTSTDYNNYNNYYNNYKAERQYRYHGGRVTAAPFRIVVPSKAHRLVAIDLGGYAGRISASISIEPPPRGFLPPARSAQEDLASQIAVREAPKSPKLRCWAARPGTCSSATPSRTRTPSPGPAAGVRCRLPRTVDGPVRPRWLFTEARLTASDDGGNPTVATFRVDPVLSALDKLRLDR
jgi:hypothetical protein